MKITLPTRKTGERGIALIVTLTFAVLCGVALGSYLVLVSSDSKMVNRSQDWNLALAYAEAGVDEALAQINAASGNFAANGWGGGGGTYGPVTRNMANGYYKVKIVGDTAPTIYSVGYVNVAGTSGQQVTRAVQVSSKQLGLLPVAFAALNNINLNGGKPEWTSDSYNSHNPNLSSNGQYDPSKTSTNGNIASIFGIIDLGNHQINGSVYLGPTASLDQGGTISGVIYSNYNVQFPPVVVPTPPTGWVAAVPVTTTTYTTNISKKGVVTITSQTSAPEYHITSSGYYKLTGNYPVEIDPGVAATNWVTSSQFDMTGLQIHDGGDIANSGTAVFYMDGPSTITAAGNGAIDASMRPENLWIYGTDKLTSITFSGNAQFTGVIYALNAAITLNGGGNNSLDVAGSFVVKSFTLNGQFNIHYDEYLSSLGSRGYIPTSWQEVAWQEF